MFVGLKAVNINQQSEHVCRILSGESDAVTSFHTLPSVISASISLHSFLCSQRLHDFKKLGQFNKIDKAA